MQNMNTSTSGPPINYILPRPPIQSRNYAMPSNQYPIIIKNSSSGIISGIIILLIIIATVGVLIYTGAIPNPLSKSSTQNTPLCSNGKVYDQSIQTCRINCEKDNLTYFSKIDKCCDTETTEYVDTITGCMKKCDTDKKRCGYDCYDPVYNECTTKDVQICPNSLVRHYKDINSGSTITECCGKVNNIQTYPVLNDTTGDEECKTCQFTVCGNQCCPDPKSTNQIDPFNTENIHAGEICLENKACCNIKYIGVDDLTGKSVCCQTELCNEKCCSGSKVCNPDKNICEIKCGDSYCTNTEICLIDNGIPSCVPVGCQWDRTNYEPKSVNTSNPSDLYPTNNIPLCKTANQGVHDPYWVVSDKTSSNLLSKVSIPLLDSNPKCNTSASCNLKISEKSLEQIVYKDGSGMINKYCTADANCSKLLPTYDQIKKSYTSDTSNAVNDYYNKTSCPLKDSNGNDTLQCCIDPVSKEFSGLVCPQSQICYNDNSSDKNYLCYNVNDNSSIPKSLNNCNNNGTVNATSIKNNLYCQCKTGYKGATCQYSNLITCSGNGIVDDNGNCVCAIGYGNVPGKSLCSLKYGYKVDGTTPLDVKTDITFSYITKLNPSITTISNNTNTIMIFLMPGIDITYEPFQTPSLSNWILFNNALLSSGILPLSYFPDLSKMIFDKVNNIYLPLSNSTSAYVTVAHDNPNKGIQCWYFDFTKGSVSFELNSQISINVGPPSCGVLESWSSCAPPTFNINWKNGNFSNYTNYYVGNRYVILGAVI